MTWAQSFEQTVAHYAALAMTPGWWQYARQQVASLEACPEHGPHWQGLRQAVAQRIQAAGFRPAPCEQAPWFREPSRLPVSRARRGGW